MTISHIKRSVFYAETVFIFAHRIIDNERLQALLSPVGALPVLLRAILGARYKSHPQIMVVVNPVTGPILIDALCKTRRLPDKIVWVQVSAEATLQTILRNANVKSDRVMFIAGDRIYHPDLHQAIYEWNGAPSGVEFVSFGVPIGIFLLSQHMAINLAAETESDIVTCHDLYNWMEKYSYQNVCGLPAKKEVSADLWQIVGSIKDCATARSKLERWLTKPTDGIFARFNRRMSIPLSRQLSLFPITPNMISLFTLGVSVVGGVFFALGGYWNCLLGAFLSVCASILDGCDGEIARLKMQTSDFGCWLDSICDYLYYLITFVCMPIGLMRSSGDPKYLWWGVAILIGAIIMFTTTIWGRKWLTHGHPEQFLSIWQKRAEGRSAGLLVNIGRHTEFIVRRCFLPYFILFLALFGLSKITVYLAAIGANIAWIISLRSLVVFAHEHHQYKKKCIFNPYANEKLS